MNTPLAHRVHPTEPDDEPQAGPGAPAQVFTLPKPDGAGDLWISSVRVRLHYGNTDKSRRLVASVELTFCNALALHGLGVVEGEMKTFVTMPNTKRNKRCSQCSSNIPITSRFCAYCGRQVFLKAEIDRRNGRPLIYADVAHPINAEVRDMISEVVLDCLAEARYVERAAAAEGSEVG